MATPAPSTSIRTTGRSPKIGTAFDRLLARYEGSGRPFMIRTRPYYSSAAIVFNYVDDALIGGTQRAFAVAGATIFNEFGLFGYSKNDDITLGFNIPRPAQDDDTNQAQKFKTNNEDFAIEGFAIRPRGYRVQYDAASLTNFATDGVTNQNVVEVLGGLDVINDPGAVVVPPEFSSPLILEDAIWQAIAPKLTLTPIWDRKASDLIGTADEFPEGGANSMLRANGMPEHHNFCRIPEGFTWEKEGDAEDTLFSLQTRLIENVVIPVTQPQGYNGLVAPLVSVGSPELLFMEFKVKAMGRAFYCPSSNS